MTTWNCRFAAALLVAGCMACGARAEGWSLWPFGSKTSSTTRDGTIGGAPQMYRNTSSAGSSWSPARTWAGVQRGTKKAWNTTVDVVTLKPLRTPKPQPPHSHLGLHRDPRHVEPKPGLLSSMFRSSTTEQREPRTVEEFFSQDRPR